jgi:hypothetical protein
MELRIKACKVLKIPFTSALAILIRMADKRIIDTNRSRAVLDALVRYGRYGDAIIKDARERLGIEEDV